ncbi:hypothetical protein Q3G72_033606 [Acer saccharum]|nr:hypothetical protein Q3G72_033606 [Acer saccharum]
MGGKYCGKIRSNSFWNFSSLKRRRSKKRNDTVTFRKEEKFTENDDVSGHVMAFCRRGRSRGKEDKMRECLISLVRIGVTCSTETPNERMGISEIVMELKAIKQGFLGMVIHGQRRVRMQLTGPGTSQLDDV